ncbi:MAG: hypothetical protein K8F31_08115 [Roseovarius sp.]|nr:hypothetical protein [Roseovarius sp.]
MSRIESSTLEDWREHMRDCAKTLRADAASDEDIASLFLFYAIEIIRSTTADGAKAHAWAANMLMHSAQWEDRHPSGALH